MPLSNYEIYLKAPFNQLSSYPVKQTIPSQLYQPVAPWTGRLILPPLDQQELEDSILFEVYSADHQVQDLVGQIVKLRWSQEPDVQAYPSSMTQDVVFTKATEESQASGILHPTRLNQRSNVGPLESLAGAHSQDDVVVRLQGPVVLTDDMGEAGADYKRNPVLTIMEEPVQITGRFHGLVTILNRDSEEGDHFQVRHYNKTSKRFDGPQERIRIPQAVPSQDGISKSTNYRIDASPLNAMGWYLYGAQDTDGTFVDQRHRTPCLSTITAGRGDFRAGARPSVYPRPKLAPNRRTEGDSQDSAG